MEDPTKPPSPPSNSTRAKSKNAALLNFRSLVMQYILSSAPNMASQKDQIEQRIQELVPSCPTPRHPTYNWMIEDAITRLNGEQEGSSSAESISNFIIAKHKDLLPLAHATLLRYHLKNLCGRGFLVLNDDGLYFLGKETNHPEQEPQEPESATDPDPSLDYGYESDSTFTSSSSSGESFSPIKEREMIKQLKDKPLRIRREGKHNVHFSRQSRKRDSVVRNEVEQESEVDEERIHKPRTEIRKRKRGRPRKDITSSCSSNQIPLGRLRMNVNVGEAPMGQDEVVPGKSNWKNGNQGFRPQIQVYTVDSDDTANIGRVEQSDEDIEDVDLIIDQIHEEFEAVDDDTQSFIENNVICPRTEEQHSVQVEKNLVNDKFQVEPTTVVTDIVPQEQKPEPSMERTGSLQRDALTEETEKGMNISEANELQNMIEATEFEDENQNEPNETIDVGKRNCQDEFKKIAMDIAPEEQEGQVGIEKSESLQNDARAGEPNMNAPHDVNDLRLHDQACSMNNVEFQERESDVIGVENILKDESTILEEQDKQAVTEQSQPESQQCEVRVERTELLQKHVHGEETAKNINITEAHGVKDLIEELEFENENHNETMDSANVDNQSEPSPFVVNVALEGKKHQVSMERTESLLQDLEKEETGSYVTVTKECGEERDTNEQSAGSQTCLTNDIEYQERDSDFIEEESHLEGALERSEEQVEQAITEQNQPQEHECEVIMEKTDLSKHYAHIEETGKDANETEAVRVCDLSSEELIFENANQSEPTELYECHEETECNDNEQSAEDRACEVNDVELQDQEYEESRFSGETEEENEWEDACELVEEQNQQAFTERYKPDKEDEELNIPDESCKLGKETGIEQFPSQKLQKDSINEGESQQSEDQKQELEMHEEYENHGGAQCASEIKESDASKELEEKEDTNQQLKERGRDASPSQILQEDGGNKSKSQQLEEQNQVIEMHKEYENLDQARPPLEKEKMYASREQVENRGVSQFLNELKQNAAKIGEGKGISEGMMGIEVLVEFGERSRESMLECEQICVSEKMELESHCGERTFTLEQRSDISIPKKSFNVKALNVVQQVEKRQLRPRPNKAQPMESEAQGSIVVPSLEKSSETNPHKKVRVTKQLEQGTRRSLRLQNSKSGN